MFFSGKLAIRRRRRCHAGAARSINIAKVQGFIRNNFRGPQELPSQLTFLMG
jgi:hypothetical protein